MAPVVKSSVQFLSPSDVTCQCYDPTDLPRLLNTFPLPGLHHLLMLLYHPDLWA